MPGTGIHGYTGTSANGQYNIVNGIIQSSAPSTSASSISSGSSNSAAISAAVNALAQQTQAAMSNAQASNMAASIANTASHDNSDYADMIREILAESQKNTAQSQAFAREQMDFQTRSDQAAMAWSAAEAAKNRDWQESLADTAHQREVRDLIAAGLNPILSSNAGAYTGSGATGQGFSSSGAMGQVDNSGSAAIGSLFNTVMNTASQAAIAGLYVDAERYQADRQYAASKMATEASILNNQNTNSANKEMAANALRGDLQKAAISAEATKYSADKNLAAAGTSAAAMRYSADQSAAANRYSADQAYAGHVLDAETQKYLQEHNIIQNPVDATLNGLESAVDWISNKTGFDIPTSIPEIQQRKEISDHSASHRF